MKSPKQYALYKGDTYLCGGTKKELADYLGVKLHTITFYKSNTWLKRVEERKAKDPYIVIEIEESEID